MIARTPLVQRLGCRRLILALFLSLFLCLAGCSPTPTPIPVDATVSDLETTFIVAIDRRHPTYPLIAPSESDVPFPEPRDTWFDFQSRSPREFLDAMALTRPIDDSTPFGPVRSFEEIHRGWVQKSDLPELIARLDDPTPTVKIILVTCSILPRGAWTTGELAAYRIEGYRAEFERTGYGGFPPSLSSEAAQSGETVRAWALAHLGG